MYQNKKQISEFSALIQITRTEKRFLKSFGNLHGQRKDLYVAYCIVITNSSSKKEKGNDSSQRSASYQYFLNKIAAPYIGLKGLYRTHWKENWSKKWKETDKLSNHKKFTMDLQSVVLSRRLTLVPHVVEAELTLNWIPLLFANSLLLTIDQTFLLIKK